MTLNQSLEEIRKRIEMYLGTGINEDATKVSLISPTLRALGWDIEDLHEVHPQYPTTAGGFADYALFIDRTLRYLVEAKPLDENLGNVKWANQLVSYASATGTRWGVLTNGIEYRIYNVYAEVPIEQKVFHTVRLDSQDSNATEILSLISRNATLENRLIELWEAELEYRRKQRVRQQVQSTLKALVAQTPPNERFIRLLRDCASSSLSLSDAREGLGGIRVKLESDAGSSVPNPVKPPVVEPEPTPPVPVGRIKGSQVSLKDLVDSGIVAAPLDIHRIYKKRLHKARIETTGYISFEGKRYWSPSGAGSAVRILHGAPPNAAATAGWSFWKFIDNEGKTRPINDLRRRLLEQKKT